MKRNTKIQAAHFSPSRQYMIPMQQYPIRNRPEERKRYRVGLPAEEQQAGNVASCYHRRDTGVVAGAGDSRIRFCKGEYFCSRSKGSLNHSLSVAPM